MTQGQRVAFWTVIAILGLLFLAAIAIPNLLRSRYAADQASLIGKMRNPQLQEQKLDKLALFGQVAAPEKKLIYNAELGMTVRDVRETSGRIRKLVEADRGEIDKMEIMGIEGGAPSATIQVRVPASGLESVLAEFKKLAVRVEREQVSSRDVTREFYDNEAHLRNLQAEEQQYLAIMKQAKSVKDTLEVSGKLSEVRDRIERLQAQIQVMTHAVEMSLIAIVLAQQSDTRVFGSQWRPLFNAKVAFRDLFSGLSDWLDWIVAVLIKLPLIVLWLATIGVIAWGGWKVGRWGWLRWFKPRMPEEDRSTPAL
ncbi:MAG TPA: DUF4349 domain-containing protein [Terriglobales bacterium]|nr:DUF4349 domain-containing protein [Terriglobales bacterium]